MSIQKKKEKQEEILTVTEVLDRKHQEDLQRLRGFRLLDDDFLTKCFEGNTECTELVLRIVLNKKDLKVADVRTQVFVENLLNRSVRMDILATDSAGRKKSKEEIAIMCKAMEDMRIESWQEGVEAGMRAGRQEGIQEGIQAGMKSTAIRMLEAEKYELDEIAAISGLSLDEVKELSAAHTK